MTLSYYLYKIVYKCLDRKEGLYVFFRSCKKEKSKNIQRFLFCVFSEIITQII